MCSFTYSAYVWAWWGAAGGGAGGAVRGNVTLRIAKQKTKQLPGRKGKARKSMPVAI